MKALTGIAMRALSIKTRLIIFSMLFCIVGLVLVGGYSYYIARNSLLERTFNQLTSVREEKGRQVEQFFHDRIREVQLVAGHSEIKWLVSNLSNEESFDTKLLVERPSLQNLMQFLVSAQSYSGVGLALNDGRVLCINIGQNELPEQVIFSRLDAKPVLETLYQKVLSLKKNHLFDFTDNSFSNTNSAYVAAPLFHANSEFLGVVFLEIPDIAMNKLMAERIENIGLGKTGEVYLVGNDLLMRSSSRFVENSLLNVECNTTAIEDALQGEYGTAKIIDYRGVRVLSSYAPLNIPNLHWVIAAEIDWSEALEDVSRLKNRIIVIGLIVFIVITIGVFLFSWRVTNPIIKLKDAAIRVGDGKFDWIIPVEQRDEIGLLTQVFNKMTLRIRHTTQRLQEREQRLLHFYRATVDGILLYKSDKPVLVNRALTSLSGYSEEELLMLSPNELFNDEINKQLGKNPSEVHSFESVVRTKVGVRIPVEVQYRIITFHNQDVEALVIRDISERKAIENELRVERLHRLRSVIDGQEQERQRLSRELHDGLGQTLVAIKLRLESIPLDKLGEQRKTIEMIKQMFSQTIEETRRISNNLMPAALTEFSLAVVLRNLCNEFEINSGISVSLVVGVLPESLSMLTKTYAYRIAQEALTNVVKHSNASKTVVSVFSDINKLYLHVEDNGVGFNPHKIGQEGNGLYNMKERASLLNGKFEVLSSIGEGTKINVEIPISNISKVQDEA